MLSEETLRARLPDRGLGAELLFYRTIGSTNDEAAARARQGASEGLVVVAEEQTAGRGRSGHTWFTPPGSALALSVLLRPRALAAQAIGGLSALGALAVVEALVVQGAAARIKWPNDVLLGGRKVAGILVEAAWRGQELEHAVVGIGVNVRPASVPEEAEFPATSVEAELGRSVDRAGLLVAILEGLGRWYPRLGSEALLQAWEDRLAFRGQEVLLVDDAGKDKVRGVVDGLLADGRLKLRTPSGDPLLASPEGCHLRPVDNPAA